MMAAAATMGGTYMFEKGPDYRNLRREDVLNTPWRNTPKKYRPGPCRVCGKPNVKSGRTRGIYLCTDCEKQHNETMKKADAKEI